MVRLLKAVRLKKEKRIRLFKQAIIGGVSIGIFSIMALFVFVFQDIMYIECSRWMGNTKKVGSCLPNDFRHIGMDVSAYQGKIDWSRVSVSINVYDQTTVDQSIAVRSLPIDFVFIKATEGGDYSDRCFEYNFRRAFEVGIQRGAYHYFKPHTSARSQANHFIRTVQLQGDDLPPVVDVEELGHVKNADLCDSVFVMLEHLRRHYRRLPILYTYKSFWNTILSKDERLGQYPLWIAHYGVKQPGVTVPFTYWQFSSEACVVGIKGDVDLNLMP